MRLHVVEHVTHESQPTRTQRCTELHSVEERHHSQTEKEYHCVCRRCIYCFVCKMFCRDVSTLVKTPLSHRTTATRVAVILYPLFGTFTTSTGQSVSFMRFEDCCLSPIACRTCLNCDILPIPPSSSPASHCLPPSRPPSLPPSLHPPSLSWL